MRGRTLAKLHQYDVLFRRLPSRSNMEAHSCDKRGLEHLDEYEPKPAKHMRSLHDRMVERRLVVILEGATLETVKVGKTFELLNCDQHKGMIIKSGRDPGKIRPDITHQCLLMLMDSPLNRAGLLQVYIHTERNALIEINPQTRIPRTFNRFCGLMVQLLHKLSVRAADGPQRLLKLIKNPVSDHLPPGCPRICTSFSSGEAVGARTVVPEDGPATVVVGAFAHGAVNVDYTEKTVSISNYPLSAALTCAKMCSAFEEVWGVL
uniref:ribosomal RNA small subunit methyltransferase NEP1 isoform X1 n=2 Tax=Oncorhynchus TaxID=8016 RepID=UPI001EAEE18C|nr:ribosomal RNA small subunit methyltransferase NEP1 isoform X1 [Oncorhynchus gorbuscha]